MAALRLKRGEELVRSSLAARVNGYVGGYGDRVRLSIIKIKKSQFFNLGFLQPGEG